MTLQQLCKLVTNQCTVNVTKDNEAVASFERSTYASLDDTLEASVVTSVNIIATASGVKSLDVVVTDPETP